MKILICDEVDTAGAAAVNLDKLVFCQLPKTFFPFNNREIGPPACRANAEGIYEGGEGG